MSTLETLEICFQANLGGVDEQLERLAGQLDALDGAALKSGGALETAGRGLAEKLGEGFSSALPGLRQKLVGTGRDMGMWLETAARSSGADASGRMLSERFGSGVLSGAGQAGAAARTVAMSAKFDGGAGAAKNAGQMLSEGFAAGIKSRSGAVNAAASAMVAAATRKIRSMLSIHSPSKVAQGFGAFFGEGFALGISGSVDGVERAAGALANGAGAGLRSARLPDVGDAAGASMDRMVQSAVERALGGVQVTVPLNVDGIKLGEASIRGINAVTRSAGRVLLNL